MKRLLLSTAAVIALAAPAAAADLAARPYTKAPVMAPVYNWTGFYIGGFVGGAGADGNANSTEPMTAGGVFYNGTGFDNNYSLSNSFIGGGTIGYNWQPVGSPWVFGLEGEAGYLKLTRSVVDINPVPFGAPGFDSTDNTKIGDWYGVIAGRLGYAVDNVLFYGKGGVAFVDKKVSFNDNCIVFPCGGGILNLGRDKTQVTWAAGAGIEYAFAGNWSLKGEYLYLATHETYSYSGISNGGLLFTSNHTDPGVHTGKFGINYRFGGPVVAKY